MTRLALASLAFLALAASAAAGSAPRARPDRPPQERRIWTSEEVEALRAKGLISLVGPQGTPATAEEIAPAENPSAPRARLEQEKDPEWYADQAAKLREEMIPLDQEIRYIRAALASHQTREGGIDLTRENPGITPRGGIWVLENRKRDLLTRLDALEELARRNGINPGVLR